MKLVPASVTGTLDPCVPLLGATDVSVGGGAGSTVNVCTLLVSPAEVTVTVRGPGAAFAAIVSVAVI
jgi:hypothetical protein